MFRMIFTGVLACFSFLPRAESGIVTSLEDDPQHKADGAEIEAVGALIGVRTDGSLAQVGSVSLVDRYWAQASVHQFGVEDFQSYSVRFGTNLLNEYSSHLVAEVIFHPSFTSIGNGLDLSMIRFETPVSGVRPIAYYEGTYSAGDTFRLVGFGLIGEPGGPTSFDGYKRGGYNALAGFGLTDDYLRFRLDPPGHPDFVDLEMSGSNGYSGGSLLLENHSLSEWQLAAVPVAAGSTYGSSMYASPLDIPWSRSYIDSTTAVPEPSSFALLSIAAGVVALRRRRLKSRHDKL